MKRKNYHRGKEHNYRVPLVQSDWRKIKSPVSICSDQKETFNEKSVASFLSQCLPFRSLEVGVFVVFITLCFSLVFHTLPHLPLRNTCMNTNSKILRKVLKENLASKQKCLGSMLSAKI